VKGNAASSARRLAVTLALLIASAALPCWSQTPTPGDAGEQVPAGPIPVAPPPPTKSWTRWFNPATAPFIPIPEIAVDPDSGTTLGVIPTWIRTDDNHNISRIIAPDILYNEHFGWGVHGRIYAYSSQDEQWSVVAGIKERVERKLDAEYQIGRSREDRWSVNYSLLFDRDGTPRFYGIGNDTPNSAESNYTSQQDFAQVQAGYNFNHTWQLLYTGRFQVLDVLPGTLEDIPSTPTAFPTVTGLGTNKLFLNRLSVVYDTRNDLAVPTRGSKWVIYGGAASDHGLLNDSLYSEAGIDGRVYWPVMRDTVLAGHISLRYMPTAHDVPFWALSNIGGGQSEIGGGQPLRGFGAGRYYDRNAFSTTVELRRKVFTFDAVATKLDIEVAPFVDLGRVFASTSSSPVGNLHQVYGVGFRGIARPFVVGYVDLGYGSDGVAVFTGLNYPF
jgi:Omp85 superfamily domain